MSGALLESKDMPAWRAVLLCLVLTVPAWGADPPAIRRQGVVNAASQRSAAVGGGIARGSLITIHGVRFAAAASGNRILLERAGSTPRALVILHADPQRLDAWIPPDVPPGDARLRVVSDGLEAPPEPIAIRKAAPGLFSANGEGWGPARAVGRPVARGGRVTLAATSIAPGDAPEIRVGNTVARVLSIRAAAAPNYVAEIAIQLPADAPEGCFVPVYARVPGAPPSNTVTIPIAGGAACAGAVNDPAAGWEGGKTAVLTLTRTIRRTVRDRQDRTEDEVNAGFFDVPADKTRASPLLLIPPPGVCTTWAGALTPKTAVGSSIWTLLFGGVTGEGLDAGSSVLLRTPSVQIRVPVVTGAPGLYRRTLSGPEARFLPRGRVALDGGRFGIASLGGPRVGSFATALPAPAEFSANRPDGPIDRSRFLSIEWNAPEADGTMAVVVLGADTRLNVAGLTYCNASKAAGRLTIPAELMTQLPTGRGDLVMASWWTRPITPEPSGIAHLIGMSAFARSWEVQIQ